MKKRSDVRVGVPISSTKPAPTVTPPSELDALHGPAAEAGWLTSEGEVARKAATPGGPGPTLTMQEGDELIVEAGAETFAVGDGHSFWCGPIIIKRKARGGEDFGTFYAAARAVAEAAFEAEFELKSRSFREHLKRVEREIQ